MQEIGIESSVLKQILSGTKTIEVRLGKPKFLKMRVGDNIALREEVWQDGTIIRETHEQGRIKITQLLYFENFDEMLGAIDYKATLPLAESKADALKTYRQFYSKNDEYEYGVVAITFELE